MRKPGHIRIIGGEWRGRKLSVLPLANLRPTPDRVRETLFNWLMPMIQGATCLDAFAGTGILGFEALSRGAKQVTWIDHSKEAIAAIHHQCALFKVPPEKATSYVAHVPDQISHPAQPWDIVFLDPPYAEPLLLPTCFYLEAHHLLASTATIYLESNQLLHEEDLPKHWHIVKQKKAGMVVYHLIQRLYSVSRI